MKKRIVSISVIITCIIIIVTLAVSYGFISSKVTSTKPNKKETFIARNMELTFSGGTESLFSNNTVFKPGSVLEKTFTVKNTGNVDFTYSIKLENLINTFKRTNDITYELYKDDELVKSDTFPVIPDLLIYTDVNIEKNEVHNYLLKIIYNNSTENQIEDSGSSINANITFVEKNNGNMLFSEVLMRNGAIVEDYDDSDKSIALLENRIISEMPETITGISNDAEDSGIFTAEDDDGTSYIYRGTIRNNFVSFAGFTWRILRINGDGNIRLILDGTLQELCNGQNSFACSLTEFNTETGDNAYVGYMYGLTGVTTDANRCLMLDENDDVVNLSTTYTTESACVEAKGTWTTSAYEATHANIKSSTIKKKNDSFYESFIKTNYSNYLGDSTFCGDKSTSNDNTGYGNTSTIYGAYARTYWHSTTTPSLKCEGRFSKYNVKENLMYPISLISADELVMAGAFKNATNYRYYLHTSISLYNYWWSLSPGVYYESGEIRNLYSSKTYNTLYHYLTTSIYGIRPVINLDKNVLYDSGEGTSKKPYTVKLASE